MSNHWFADFEKLFQKHEARLGLVMGVLLSLLACLVVYLITASNIGISTDSRFYLATAKRAMDDGLLAGVDSTGHFPPLYPWALALMGKIFGDLETGARWLNIICAGLTVFFLHQICQKEIQNGQRMFSHAYVLLGLSGFILADDFLRLSSFVLSELLFITLLTGGILILQRAHARMSSVQMCAGGLVLGLATLSRHTGLFFLGASVLWVFLASRKKGRSRWQETMLYAFAAGFLIILAKLIIRPSGTRALAFHWPGEDHWHDFGVTFASWFLPYRFALPQIGWMIAVALIVYCVIRLIRWLQTLANGGMDEEAMSNYLAASAIAYLFLLFVTVVWIYYITPFDYRLLFPVHVVMLTFLIGRLCRVRFSNRGFYCAIITFLCIWFAGQALKGVKTIRHYSVHGVGIGSKKNLESAALKYLQEVPEAIVLVSNKPEVIEQLMSRRCDSIPSKFNSFTMAPEARYENEMKILEAKLSASQAVLVWFLETDRPYHPKIAEVTELIAMEKLPASDDKVLLYMVRPAANP